MSVVFTIGYEGTNIDSFVETLKYVGIKRLADVRALPLSRKKGFSKNKLAERLAAAGIEYLPFRQLGDPKPGRDAARAGKYDQFRKIYSAHLATEEARASLDKLMTVVAEQPTCLLCFERDPETCHRSMIAEELGIQVFDLYGDDPKRYVRNSTGIPRHHRSEGAAAA